MENDPKGSSTEGSIDAGGMSRRMALRLGAAGGLGAALVAAQGFGGPFLARKGLLSADGAFAATSTALGDLLFYIEAFPTSPLIISPFRDPLPIPKAMAPTPPAAPSLNIVRRDSPAAPPDSPDITPTPQPGEPSGRAVAPRCRHVNGGVLTTWMRSRRNSFASWAPTAVEGSLRTW